MKASQILLALSAASFSAAAPLDAETGTVSSLHARQFTGSTYNQLIDGTPCRAVTMIYARGTTQQGNVGDPAAVGPLFFNNLAQRIGLANLAVQGVTYPANVNGFLQGGDPAGSRTMASLVSRAVTQCPNTQIVMSGYSQGAQLVHNAASTLTSAQANRVTAVLTFGDPKRSQGFGAIPASRTRVICRTGDNICAGGTNPSGEHTRYQLNAPEAAAWVAARVA